MVSPAPIPRLNKFQSGQIVITPNAASALQAAGQDAVGMLARHLSADWGNVDGDDKKLNDKAISHEEDPELRSRVLSAYKTSLNETVWIITESDRTVTTILLPEDY